MKVILKRYYFVDGYSVLCKGMTMEQMGKMYEKHGRVVHIKLVY